MKDLHTHILPGIDDGCKTLEESIHILKTIASSGITELAFTPHYIENSRFICNNKEKKMLFNKINNEIKKLNIPIRIYLGNEIFFSENILELLAKKEILPIHHSKYLLIEFPVMHLPYNAKNVFSELIYSGYKIILAHPERYFFVMDDINILKDFLRMGVLLQGNYESLYGKYGKKAKKTLKKLLRKGWISFLCSDIHKEVRVSEKKLRKKLRWYLSKEEINQVLNENFDCVVKNKKIKKIKNRVR